MARPEPAVLRGAGPAAWKDSAQMKVLLVEDESRLASTLAAGLRAEGCVVVTAQMATTGYGMPSRTRSTSAPTTI
jgi:hypothetical protein